MKSLFKHDNIVKQLLTVAVITVVAVRISSGTPFYTTVATNYPAVLNFSSSDIDEQTAVYHQVLSAEDSDVIVLNISSFSVNDPGGAKLLIAVEIGSADNIYPTDELPADFWKDINVISWTGSCNGGHVRIQNFSRIHVFVYQLIQLTRFEMSLTVCTDEPCFAEQQQSLLHSHSCLSAPHSRITKEEVPRAFHSLVRLEDCHYTFGGLVSMSPFNDLAPFISLIPGNNCDINALDVRHLTFGRRYLSGIISASSPNKHRIFAIGGIDEDISPVNSGDGYLEIRNRHVPTWVTMPTLLLFGHSACAMSINHIYIYGGSRFDGVINDFLLEWESRVGKWRLVTHHQGFAPPPLFGHTLTCSQSAKSLYLFGGFSLNTFSRLQTNDVLYKFNIRRSSWEPVLTLESKYFHGATLIPAKQQNPGRSLETSIREEALLAIAGGSSRNLLIVDPECKKVIGIAKKLESSGLSLLVASPEFRLSTSGGMTDYGIIDANPVDLEVEMPLLTEQCPEKSRDKEEMLWRCALALNPGVAFQSNTSTYYYDSNLPTGDDLTTFVDVDILAHKLSHLTSKLIEWTLRCQGWMRLSTARDISLASVFSDGNVGTLNFRFSVYLFVDGTLVQSYTPAGINVLGHSLNFIEPDEDLKGNSGRGIYLVSVFLNGYGPILPNGADIQLRSHNKLATYQIPTSILSSVLARRHCSLKSSQRSCQACLLDPVCSWIVALGSCTTRQEVLNIDSDIISDPAACPSCFRHARHCRDCTQQSADSCTWLPTSMLCAPNHVTENIPEATTTCEEPCFNRKTCDHCTSDRCLWCEERSICVDYWLAEAGVPAALGCTRGCPPPRTTPPPTTTACSEDKSWCGTVDNVCVEILAARALYIPTTVSPTENPIDAFPMMRDDDFFQSTPQSTFPPTTTEEEVDIETRILLSLNLTRQDVCSGNGECVSPGRCKCNKFWQGDSCEKECRCYGRAYCPDPDRPDVCICPPGTTGKSCESCLPGYTGKPSAGFSCRSCYQACNGFAENCFSKAAIKKYNLTNYSPGVVLTKKLPIAESSDDIKCIGCRDFTSGDKCDHCVPGYFRPTLYGRTGLKLKCERCFCNGHSDYCEENGGYNCKCRDNTQTRLESTPNSMGCEQCARPFIGDPRRGRPCYLPVSQNQQLCLWQDGMPSLTAKRLAAANMSDLSSLCRFERDSILLPSFSMHLASHVPMGSELRIFLGIISGEIDLVMTIDPGSLRPPPEVPQLLVGNRQKRQIHGSSSQYDYIHEVNVTRNAPGDKNGDSIVYLNREQFLKGPIAIRKATGRMLVVISPPDDQLQHGNQNTDGEKVVAKQVVVFYLRITATSEATINAASINNDSYYALRSEYLAGEPATGVVAFRQDEVQIDVFVFFSVFLALFVLLLLALLLIIRFHSVVRERRRVRARIVRKRAMIKRPFGVSWPRYDLPLLFNQLTKLPMKLSDFLIPGITLPQPDPTKPPLKTATIVTLQPAANLKAAVATVAIKLPVSKPVARQSTAASGFNADEMAAIVTSVPPPPMAFGTFLMKVIVQEIKKGSSKRKAKRAVSPTKPGQNSLFDRDSTLDSINSMTHEPYILVTPEPPPQQVLTGNRQPRQPTGSTISVPRLSSPSSVSLPPTPDTLVSTRDGGDDLDDLIDDIVGSASSQRTSGARRRNNVIVLKQVTRRRPQAAQTRIRIPQSMQIQREVHLSAETVSDHSTPATSWRSEADSVLTEEVPKNSKSNNPIGRGGQLPSATSRPPLPPSGRLKTAVGRRRSIPVQRQRHNAPPSSIGEEDSSF